MTNFYLKFYTRVTLTLKEPRTYHVHEACPERDDRADGAEASLDLALRAAVERRLHFAGGHPQDT
jgi:hypothetical protein